MSPLLAQSFCKISKKTYIGFQEQGARGFWHNFGQKCPIWSQKEVFSHYCQLCLPVLP